MGPEFQVAVLHFCARRSVYEGLEEAFHAANGPRELRALYMRTLNSVAPCLKMPEPYAYISQDEGAPYMAAALAVDELILEKLQELWPDAPR